MQPIEAAVWSAEDRGLWRRIEAHDFEPAGHALTFTRRLARDHGWSLEFARGAVEEYRRFCFLAMVGGREVTPSEEVDEVWHQHLTYSKDYWGVWCPLVLGADLHHQPTAGGEAEQSRFVGQYAATLALYEAYFGPPDRLYWPGTADRFRPQPRYRIVDGDRILSLPLPYGLKPRLRQAAAGLGLIGLLSVLAISPAEAEISNPLDWTAEPFLELYVILAVGALLGAALIRAMLKNGDRLARPDGLGAVELAYLAGGPRRAVDLLVLACLSADAASIDKGKVTMSVGDKPLPAYAESCRAIEPGAYSRFTLYRTLSSRLGSVRDDLVERGLALSPNRIRLINVIGIGLVALVMGFGIVKIGIGQSRGKPVGYLTALVFATGVAGLIVLRPPRRTSAGDAALSEYERDHNRAIRAPLASEVALAFALAGPTALTGTAFADYGGLIRSSSSSGCSGGSSCGGGGGGGGCGGCGGGS